MLSIQTATKSGNKDAWTIKLFDHATKKWHSLVIPSKCLFSFSRFREQVAAQLGFVYHDEDASRPGARGRLAWEDTIRYAASRAQREAAETSNPQTVQDIVLDFAKNRAKLRAVNSSGSRRIFSELLGKEITGKQFAFIVECDELTNACLAATDVPRDGDGRVQETELINLIRAILDVHWKWTLKFLAEESAKTGGAQ